MFHWLFLLLLPSSTVVAAPFTPGNIVVLRIGDGSNVTATTAAPVFLDEFALTNTFSLIQSIVMPTVVNGANHRLVSGSESGGTLVRSADGHFLSLCGYDEAVGVGLVYQSTTPRVVALVDSGGDVDTTTTIIASSYPNSVASVNGSAFWFCGTVGILFQTFGAAGQGQRIYDSQTFSSCHIFNQKLYASRFGIAGGVFRVGDGLPTANVDVSLVTNASAYDFFLADLDAFGGVDTLYAACGGIGVQKHVYDNALNRWRLGSTHNVAGAGAFGIAGVVVNRTVTLYVTSFTGNFVAMVIDDGKQPFSTYIVTTIATAPSNTRFKGVDIAPVAAQPISTTAATTITATAKTAATTSAVSASNRTSSMIPTPSMTSTSVFANPRTTTITTIPTPNVTRKETMTTTVNDKNNDGSAYGVAVLGALLGLVAIVVVVIVVVVRRRKRNDAATMTKPTKQTDVYVRGNIDDMHAIRDADKDAAQSSKKTNDVYGYGLIDDMRSARAADDSN